MRAAEQRRETNRAKILACLETCGPSSTKTIARLTGIRKTAVGNTLGNLWRCGIVRQHDTAASGASIWAHTGKHWLGVKHDREHDAPSDTEHLAWMAYWRQRREQRLMHRPTLHPGQDARP